MLAEGDHTRARKLYRDLVTQGREIDTEDILEQEDSIDRFRSKLDSLISRFFNRIDHSARIAQLLGVDVTSMDEMDKLIEEARGAKWQRTPASREANKYLIEQLLARGYNRAQIAQRLGISRKTIHNILRSSP
jgi:putative transposase